MGNEAELWKVVEAHRQDLVAFAQKLVQTPSPSGQEGDVSGAASLAGMARR